MNRQMAGQTAPGVTYVDTTDVLAATCREFRRNEWVALDTEFMREKTYYPKLCLVQIGIPGRCVCIDPLALDDLEPLYELMFDTAVTKVLHACSQDLEIFVHLTGRVPRPIFDTQLAAPLLGLAEQIGYGNFIREILGVHLDKAHARADWSRRPLSAAQLAYAADDVRYLADAYPQVTERLGAQARLDWLDAEFAPYERLERYQNDPATAWQRLRGLEKLRPRALSIAQQLAAWRERQAQDRDLPRNWILKDDMLFDIARLAPQNLDDLAAVRGLSQKVLERYGEALLALVRDAAGGTPQPLPGRGRRERTTVAEEALADYLQAALRVLAAEHDINGSIIASRKDLLALIRNDNTPLLKGWRRKIAGDALLSLCDGQRRLTVRDRQIEIDAAT
jgi:ribonuclease D